jgi:hypothetical protein
VTLTVEGKGGDDAGSTSGPSQYGAAPTKRGAVLETFKLNSVPVREAEKAIRKHVPNFSGRMAVDERTNSISIESDDQTITRIKAVVQQLDKTADSNLGPVQIELSGEGDQVVLRGDPKDVERVEKWLKELEKGAAGKQGEKPEDLLRRLGVSAAKTSGKDDARKVSLSARVFQLRSTQARNVVELLQKVFDKSGTRIEADERANSIIAMADAETMATIAELLKALDQPISQVRRANTSGPESLVALEHQAKKFKEEITRVESEMEKDQKELERVSKFSANLINEGKDTKSIEDEKRRLTDSIQSKRIDIDKVRDRHWSVTQEIESLKARIEAINRGEFPEALLMEKINDDPRLVELRQKIAEQEELHDLAKSIAKHPNDPAVLRYAARLRHMKEAEDRLIAELREVAVAKLRWGPGGAYETSGIVEGTQKSPGGETKIFSLRNTQATEAYEVLRKLYSEDMVRMTAHQSTNQVLVQGDPEKLAEIEAILLRLDEEGARKVGKNDPSATQGTATPPAGRRRGSRTTGSQITPEDIKRQREQIESDIAALRARRLDAINQLNSRTNPNTRKLNDEVNYLDRQIRMHENWLRELDVLSGPRATIINPGDSLRINAAGTLQESPIKGVYSVDPDGYVNLGAEYGKVRVSGMTADEAQAAVLAELRKVLREPKVTLTFEHRGQTTARPSTETEKATESPPATGGSESRSSLEIQLPALREELAKTKALAYQKEDEIFALSLEVLKSGKDLSDESKSKFEALKRVKDQLVERVTRLEQELQSHTARIQESKGQPRSSTDTTPAARPRRSQETEAQQRQLRELQEQLKFVDQQLRSQIPNSRDTLEIKILKQQRDELQRQIIGLGPLIEGVPQPAASDPLANHPELVQMRRRLGDLNAKIGQDRLHQEGAKESAYLRALISQSQRLQTAIWELESLLRRENHDDGRHESTNAGPTGDIRNPQGLMKPFTAIRWEGERPQVQINEVWYDLLAIGELPIEQIIAKAREKRGRGYQELIENQLPEFLKELGVASIEKEFSLALRRLRDGARETFDVANVVHPLGRVQTIVTPRP